MPGFFSTAGFARRSARRPWLVLTGWIVALVLAVVASSQLQTAMEGELTTSTEAADAGDLISERLREDRTISETVIVRSETETASSAAFQGHVQSTAAALAAMDEVVTEVVTYYDLAAAGVAEAGSMVADDESAVLLQVEMGTDIDEASEHARDYLDTVYAQTTDTYEVLTIGDVSSFEEFTTIASEDMGAAQNYGLPAALIVLVVVFGALIAAGVPIVVGLFAVAVSLGLAAGVSQFFELDFFVTNMIAMIGLAVGIDYSLFIIERYREERREGIQKLDAITVAGGTAAKAVVFSGLTTGVALVGLFLLPMTTFQSLAIGAILAVGVSVFAALTLIPAILALLGDKINWPRRGLGKAENDPVSQRRGIWARITRTVMRRPAISAIVASGLLLAISVPVLDLNTGQNGIGSLPESNVKTAYEVLHDDFYVGTLMPVRIVIEGDATNPEVSESTEALMAELASDELYGQPAIELSDDNSLAMVTAPMQVEANSDAAFEAITELREDVIPSVFDGAPANVLVGGNTAYMEDFNAMLDTWMPIVFAFVLGFAFIVLTVAFRSIVIPFMSIFMNLLSVGAAYGLLVLAFQEGYGEFLGLTHTPVIEAWIPVFLFCVLFGLSMDYHFFLLSRIRERFDLTGDNDESIASGLQVTGKIITGAAVIMVVVFGAFATGRMVDIQQLGFGLGVSVLVDATIVRSILVPSLMKLIGKYNWYLPAWLSWLPNVAIEGQRPQIASDEPRGGLAPAPAGDD